MLSALIKRREDDEGFTLVELMIVVLIIGILISIGLPTFLGARQRAQDRVAQALLRNGLTAAKVFYTDYSAYYTTATTPASAFDVATATAIEPSIKWDTTGTAVGTVVISDAKSGAEQQVTLTTTSGSGYTFCLQDRATGTNPGIYYSRSATSAGGGCSTTYENTTLAWSHS